MPKFRKKPVVVEAVRFDTNYKSILEMYRFVNGEESVILKSSLDHEKFEGLADIYIKTGFPIKTLEGTMIAMTGDWIIRGVNGEHYPCKPDIFEKTYEPADEGLVLKVSIDEAIAFSEWNCKELWSTYNGQWYPYQDEDNPISGRELYKLFLDRTGRPAQTTFTKVDVPDTNVRDIAQST